MDQIVQIAGALAILAAFVLAQVRVLDAGSLRYLVAQPRRLADPRGRGVRRRAVGFVLLEAVWALVSALGLAAAAARTRAARAPLGSA